MLNGCSRDTASIEIELALASPCRMRLDRLLASELGIARSQLRLLHECSALRISPAARKPLASLIADGQCISVALTDGAVGADLAAIIRRRVLE